MHADLSRVRIHPCEQGIQPSAQAYFQHINTATVPCPQAFLDEHMPRLVEAATFAVIRLVQRCTEQRIRPVTRTQRREVRRPLEHGAKILHDQRHSLQKASRLKSQASSPKGADLKLET